MALAQSLNHRIIREAPIIFNFSIYHPGCLTVLKSVLTILPWSISDHGLFQLLVCFPGTGSSFRSYERNTWLEWNLLEERVRVRLMKSDEVYVHDRFSPN